MLSFVDIKKERYNDIIMANGQIYQRKPKSLLGMKEFGHKECRQVTLDIDKKSIRFQESDKQDDKKFSYTIRPYKMLLLRLGIDGNNEPIKQKDSLYKVYLDLKKIFNTDTDAILWSDKYLRKEEFFEYQLAKFFKKDKKLFKKAQKVINLLGPKASGWVAYNDFLNGVKKGAIYKDKKQTPYVYDEVIKYLPGAEQMLAYFFMFHIRQLWYGAMNKEAFYATTNIRGFLPAVLFKFIKGAKNPSYTNMKKGAYKKQKYGTKKVSFISVWHEIVDYFSKLKNDTFGSFNAHGWVLSFNKSLIDLQKQVAIKNNKTTKKKYYSDLKLLDDLKIAGMESWNSRWLNTFYRKEVKENKKNEKFSKEKDQYIFIFTEGKNFYIKNTKTKFEKKLKTVLG